MSTATSGSACRREMTDACSSSIPRCSEMTRKTTGIPGLDGMLQGGFPFPAAILVAGEPGTGKTTFAVQSLFHGAKGNEKGLYITAISEPQWLLPKLLSSFSFFNHEPGAEGLGGFVDTRRH